MITRTSLLCAAALSAGTATAQTLLIPDSTADVLMAFSAADGSLIDQNFIDLGALGAPASTPIEAFSAPNGEIWVSDQFADAVFRISGDGTMFLGQTTALLDNVRGLDATGSNILVSNSGTVGGAPGDAIVEIDAAGMTVGTTMITDPFDVTAFTFNGTPGFLVPDIVNDDIIFVDGSDFSNQTIWHDSDGVSGVDFPEQVTVTSSGTVLVGGFITPDGIYEYDANGNQIDYIDTDAVGGLGFIRAAYELGNGNILFTNSGGVHIYDRAAVSITTVLSGVNARFIGEFGGGSSIGQAFCAANPNTTGLPGLCTADGSTAVADNNVTLSVAQIPPGEFGIFVVAAAAGGSAVVNDGLLCLTGPTGRYDQPGFIWQASPGGTASRTIDLTMVPTPNAFVNTNPGDTWFFQAWHRDMPSGNSNFTTGVEITFN